MSMEVGKSVSNDVETDIEDPHIGHMHSMIMADIHTRYKALWGKTTVLATGTDEHGIKVTSRWSFKRLISFNQVQKAAQANGEDPLEFCTKAAAKFRVTTPTKATLTEMRN